MKKSQETTSRYARFEILRQNYSTIKPLGPKIRDWKVGISREFVLSRFLISSVDYIFILDVMRISIRNRIFIELLKYELYIYSTASSAEEHRCLISVITIGTW